MYAAVVILLLFISFIHIFVIEVNDKSLKEGQWQHCYTVMDTSNVRLERYSYRSNVFMFVTMNLFKHKYYDCNSHVSEFIWIYNMVN